MDLQQKIEQNQWDNIEEFISVLKLMRDGKWHWYLNTDCKYVDLRVDMRDGGCIIMNRNHERIQPERLAFQYSTPKSEN